MRRRAIVTALGAFGVGAACSIDLLDPSGKACPCIDGYVCSANVCVRGGDIPDAGMVDAPPAPPPAPQIVVSNLQASWVTPNTIRWTWRAEGAAASFRTYELASAATADDLAAGTNLTVVSGAQRLELHDFDARGGKSSGPVDVWTLALDAKAGAPYYARVAAKDQSGATSVATATVNGAPPVTSLNAVGVLFDGKPVPTATPPAFAFNTTSNQYTMRVDCAGQPECANVLQLRDLKLVLPAEFTSEVFDKAFLQVQLGGDTATTNFTSSVAIVPGGCTQSDALCQYGFSGWTQIGTTKAIQVPLRELQNANGKLTYARLQGSGLAISALVIAGTWRQAATISVGLSRIRW